MTFKGYKHSDEWKTKQSERMKGNTPWNKGLTKKTSQIIEEISKKIGKSNKENARINPNYGMRGKHQTEEHKRKIGLVHKGKKLTEEHKNKIKENAKINSNYGMKGKHFSGEHCKKISKSRMGTILSEETKRKQSAAKQGILLDEWRRFVSFEPYAPEFNKQFKKYIRNRDGGCVLCNLSFEDLKLLKRRTHVHHINYDKKLTIPENCITLCMPCHIKTNFNRVHWTKFFQSLLAERYGYRYDENQNIILNLNKFQEEK